MEKIHNLLWTSGWDSTYRLLEIIFVEKKRVQPIYIIDEDRKSLQNEQMSLSRILDKICLEHNEAYQLIQPIITINKKDITISKKINVAYKTIRTHVKIGSQYEWLAAFCLQFNLKNVELCIFQNERTASLFQQTDKNVEIDLNHQNAIDCIYGNFTFPLLETNKQKMLEDSKRLKWLSIMNLTWFCHKPKKNKPCGNCNPCKIVISEGLGFRISLKNRILGNFKNIFRL